MPRSSEQRKGLSRPQIVRLRIGRRTFKPSALKINREVVPFCGIAMSNSRPSFLVPFASVDAGACNRSSGAGISNRFSFIGFGSRRLIQSFLCLRVRRITEVVNPQSGRSSSVRVKSSSTRTEFALIPRFALQDFLGRHRFRENL